MALNMTGWCQIKIHTLPQGPLECIRAGPYTGRPVYGAAGIQAGPYTGRPVNWPACMVAVAHLSQVLNLALVC